MTSFNSTLWKKINTTKTNLCVGIDLHLHQVLPDFFRKKIEHGKTIGKFVDEFCHTILEVCEGQVPAIKWQSAFFECLGYEGFRALRQAIKKARKRDFISILDAKRGDIQSTMSAYAQAAYEEFNADALTVLPYMGCETLDAMGPYLKKGKGVYVVIYSSNPTGELIQGLKVTSSLTKEEKLKNKNNKSKDRSPNHNEPQFLGSAVGTMFMQHAKKHHWQNALGFVVGAPYFSRQHSYDLTFLGNQPTLIPGIGAQGTQFKDLDKRQLGDKKTLLFPISRDFTGLGSKEHFEALNKMTKWQNYSDFLEQRLKFYQKMAQ